MSIMYSASYTVIMCAPACLQVLKTTLDLLLRERKEDKSTVDLVTHSEGSFGCLHWAVKLRTTCPCEHGGGAGSCLRGIKADQSRPAAGRREEQKKRNVIKATYLPSRAHTR